MNLRQKSEAADGIAKALYNEFVINSDLDKSGLRGLKIDENYRPAFETKMLAYKFAIVLMALVSEEKSNSKYSKVRECFEKIIDEKSQELQERLKNLTLKTFRQEITINLHIDIKQALVSLNSLLFSEDRKDFTWARKWFKEINIEENNPVNLALLAHKFMDYYVVNVKTLRQLNPI